MTSSSLDVFVVASPTTTADRLRKTMSFNGPTFDKTAFDRDIRDTHLVYDYAAQDSRGNPEKWRYELWFVSEDRVVYKIHGGPMAGRSNFQECRFQCVRPGELWQCNWLEGERNLAHVLRHGGSLVVWIY